jgi:hypothetical protein
MLTAADILAALAAAREKGEPIAIVSTLPKTSSESSEDVSAQVSRRTGDFADSDRSRRVTRRRRSGFR